MSNLNTEAYLRAKGLLSDHKIERDLPCRECGYNLRGLEYGKNCPECGTVIDRKRPEHAHLMDAPAEYLKRLRLGMWMLCVGVWGPLAAMVILHQGLSGATVGAAFAMQLTGMGLFIAGGWILTGPKPHESVAVRRWHHLSNLTRISLFVPPLLALIGLPFGATAAGATVGVGARFATFVMYTLLAVVLGDLAKWAQDDRLGTQFDYLSFAIGIFAVAELIVPLFASGGRLVGCFGPCLVTAVAVWFCACMLQLTGTLTRAVYDKAIHDASVFRDPSKEIK